jgi:MFS family permease
MKKSTTGISIVFLTLIIDLVGFSIAFPLFPSMLHYYLPQADTPTGLLSHAVNWLSDFSYGHQNQVPFLVTVFFGGMMASLYALLQFIFSPIWGKISDRLGRRKVLLMTSFGTAVGYSFWIFAGQFWMLLLSRVITGVMGGNQSVGTAAIADIAPPQNRSRAMTLVGVAFGLGFILGPVIGGLTSKIDLLSSFPEWESYGINPFSIPALVACSLALLNFFWIFARFKETIPLERLQIARQEDFNWWHASFGRFKSIPGSDNPPMRRANWVNFGFTIIFSGLEFSLSFLATERLGFSPSQNSYMFLYIGLLMVFVQGFLLRKLIPMVKERPLVLVGLFFCVSAFCAMSVVHTTLTFFAGLILVALGSGFMNVLMGLASLYADTLHRGEQLGTFRSVASLARSMGPLAGATLYFSLGSKTAYLIAAVALCVPILTALTLPKPRLSED